MSAATLSIASHLNFDFMTRPGQTCSCLRGCPSPLLGSPLSSWRIPQLALRFWSCAVVSCAAAPSSHSWQASKAMGLKPCKGKPVNTLPDSHPEAATTITRRTGKLSTRILYQCSVCDEAGAYLPKAPVLIVMTRRIPDKADQQACSSQEGHKQGDQLLSAACLFAGHLLKAQGGNTAPTHHFELHRSQS